MSSVNSQQNVQLNIEDKLTYASTSRRTISSPTPIPSLQWITVPLFKTPLDPKLEYNNIKYKLVVYPREGHSAVEVNGLMYVWGGEDDRVISFDVLRNEWHPIIVKGVRPPHMTYHCAVAYKNCIYVSGASFNNVSQLDTYKFDVATSSWSYVPTKNGPSLRKFYAMSLYKNNLILIGGVDLATKRVSEEIFVLNLDTNQWRKLNPVNPQAMSHHTIHVFRNEVYALFGKDENQNHRGVWKYDLETNLWSEVFMGDQPETPVRRIYHNSVIFNDCIFVFGGKQIGREPAVEDYLFEFHIPSRTWKIAGAKLPNRKKATMCIVQNQLVLYGGRTNYACQSFALSFMKMPQKCLSKSCYRQVKFNQLVDVQFEFL